MKNESVIDFGLLIAYLLPGCVLLAGISAASPPVQDWLVTSLNSPAFGGFLYTGLAAIGAGLVVSTVRWLLVDAIHHLTGIQQPAWDFARLTENTDAYDLIIELHYRYYQFYANTLVAGVVAYILWRANVSWSNVPIGWPDVAVAALLAIFAAASRNTLRQYYAKAGALLK